MLEKLNFADNY